MVPRNTTCCRWYCQSHPPADEGTDTQEMWYSGSSSGGTCYEKLFLLDMPGCRFVVSKLLYRLSRWEAGNTHQVYDKKTSTFMYVRAQRVQGLDRQAERMATLTLVSCVLPLLLLLLLLTTLVS